MSMNHFCRDKLDRRHPDYPSRHRLARGLAGIAIAWMLLTVAIEWHKAEVINNALAGFNARTDTMGSPVAFKDMYFALRYGCEAK